MAKQFHNRTPEELAEDYAVPLSHVYAALAYYYEHKAELDEDIRQQIAKARELKENALAASPPTSLTDP